MLAAKTRAVDRRAAGLLAPPLGPHMRAIHDRSVPIDLASVLQLVQERLLQALPDPGFVPFRQAPPAGHARLTTHLLRQVLPQYPRLEDEDNPRQRRTVGHPRAPRDLRLWERQQRLDPTPHLITQQRFSHDAELRQPHDGSYLLLGALSFSCAHAHRLRRRKTAKHPQMLTIEMWRSRAYFWGQVYIIQRVLLKGKL